MDVLRNEVKSYLNNEYKAIEAIEEKFKEEIRQKIKFSNLLYNLLPSTFYLSTANEASSRGYQNFLDFYGYLQTLRRQFVEFWIGRVYFNDPKVMVNFVQKDENVFKAKSQLPFYFIQGVIINLGYCMILFFLSFFLYKRALCPTPKKASTFKDIAMNFVPGDLTEVKVYHKEFTTQFLNVFFGKIKHFTGKLSIDADTIVTNEKKDFLYLPPKEQIPGDLKVKTFLSFSKRLFNPSNEEFQKITAGLDKSILNKTFEKLEPIDKARVLLTAAQMKKSPVYIIDTIITGIPEEDQKIISNIVQGLKTDDTVIINFSNETGFWIEPDAFKSIRFDGTKYFSLLK
jgi:ABC-type transport system involved in cytochrome c biogenesis ATPase subunit